MQNDPILEEIWKIRDQMAKEAGYDLHTYCEMLRARERMHPERLVDLSGKRKKAHAAVSKRKTSRRNSQKTQS